MITRIRQRLAMLEAKAKSMLPFWPGDDDGFVSALGVDRSRFKAENPDGSIGVDFIAALSSTAREDWKDEAFTAPPKD